MNDLHLPIHQIGYLTDESIIASLYSAADVFVTPSLEENLPNTVMEALACATPCVGFDIGGIPEMIDHKINGYVAQYQNVNDLANGIAWVLDYTDQTKLSMACVEKVRNNFNAHVVAQKYVALYEKIIDEQVDT
jgi:glycosyltransferase involved in cell wall biosynthesis